MGSGIAGDNVGVFIPVQIPQTHTVGSTSCFPKRKAPIFYSFKLVKINRVSLAGIANHNIHVPILVHVRYSD